MKRNQCGFTAVAGLLVLVIVAIIGGTGWYVMQANKNTDNTLNKAGLGTAAKSAKKSSPAPAPKADPTADWVAYSSKTGNFSLRYPSSWLKAQLPSDGCGVNDNFLMIAPDSNSLGKYCTDGGIGQVAFDSNKISESFVPKYTEGNGYKNVESKSVTVNGVAGTRQYATATGQDNGPALGALPDGTKVVFYSFTTNGKVYTAQYNQRPTYTDNLSDFDLMVTKTLKFTQ
jgi:hypothetical protein